MVVGLLTGTSTLARLTPATDTAPVPITPCTGSNMSFNGVGAPNSDDSNLKYPANDLLTTIAPLATTPSYSMIL